MASNNANTSPEESIHGEEEQKPLFPAEKSSQGGVYDDDHENEPTSIGDGGTSKPSSPSALEDAERNPASGARTAIGGKEEALGKPSGSLYNPSDSALPPQAKIVKKLAGLMTKKNARNGGILGGVAGIIVAAIFFIGSYQLVAVRENMLGKVNKYANSTQANRRMNSFSRALKDGTMDKKLNKAKFARKMSQRGFVVGYDPQTKKINKLDFEQKDRRGRVVATKSFDFTKDYGDATKDFFGGDETGRRAFREFQAATGGRASTWKGRQATKVYARYRINFANWLDEKNSDKPKNAREKFNEKVRKAQAGDTYVNNGGIDQRAVDENGNRIGEPDTSGALENSNVQEQSARLIEDPSLNPEAGTDGAFAGRVGVETSHGVSFNDALEAAKESQSPGSAAKRLAGGLNAAQIVSDGCRIKGVLNFIQNTKNVALAYQMARFAMLYNSAADHQKAGLLSSKGSALFMQYLNNKDGSGKAYTQSGGFRYMMGDTKARPNKANLAKYSTGRTDDGLLGDVRGILNDTPGLNVALGEQSCKVANNIFVQVGGFVVGGVATIFTGGGAGAAGVARSIASGLVFSVARGIAESVVIKSATGIVVNGFESGEEAGDILSSGWGSMKGISGSANGLRPLTQERAVAMEKQITSEERTQYANMSLRERYLDINNGGSLVSSLAVVAPSSFGSNQLSSLLSTPFHTLGTSSVFSTVSSLFGLNNRVHADEIKCKDPQIEKYKLQTDAFCNIEVADFPTSFNYDETEKILQTNGDIDSEGQPISEPFKKYIESCHSGRTGLLYKDTTGVSEEDIKNGNVNPSTPNDTCMVNDPSEASNPEDKQYDIYRDGKSYPGGRFARYTDWFGYRTDVQNIEDDINDTYPSSDNQDPGAATADTGSQDPVDVNGDAQQLAQKILDNNNVSYTYKDTKGVDVQEVLKGVAKTGEGLVNGDNAPNQGQSVAVNPKLLQAILEYAQDHKIGLNTLTNATHSGPGSNHYKGIAIDIGCNVPLDRTAFDKVASKYGGVNNGEVCPGNAHWHYDFPK